MLRLGLWIVFCVALAVVFRRHRVQLLAGAFCFAVFVPFVASAQFTGHAAGRLAFAAFSWLVAAIFVVGLWCDPGAFAEAMTRRFIFFASIAFVIAAAFLQTARGVDAHGLVNIVDAMVAPFAMFWIVTASAYRTPEVVFVLRRTILGAAVLEAVYALCQQAAHRIIFYNGSYHREYWYRPGYDRWMGTTDSPLVLSLVLCAAIPLVKSLRRPWLQNVANVLLLAGIVVSQSRTGLVVGVLATLYVILSARASGVRKSASVVLLLGAASAVVASGLATGVSSRVANDLGSAVARDDAYSYFFGHWQPYLFSGGGIRFSYQLANAAGLTTTSFESAFVQYCFDLGIVATVLYFLALLVLALRSAPNRRTGSWMAALVSIVVCQTFSSLESATVVAPLVFALLAIAAVERDIAVDAKAAEIEDEEDWQPPGRNRTAELVGS